MPRINIELPAAWGTPSSVMTDITNNRLSLYILHEPAPQSMAQCCTLLASFDGWKLNNPIPLAEKCFAARTPSFQLDLSGDVHADILTYAVITFEGPAQVIFCPSHNLVYLVSVVCVCTFTAVFTKASPSLDIITH